MNRDELKELYPKAPESFIKAVDRAVCDGLKDDGKVIRMRKKILLAVAATLAIGATAIGAGKAYTTTSHDDVFSEFTETDKIEDMKEELGFDFKYVTEFENGYSFAQGNTNSNTEYDEEDNRLRDYKSLELNYSGDKGMVTVFMEACTGETDTQDGEIADESQVNKIVPLDYELTDQDKEDIESGKYEFITGGGIDEVSEEECRKITWTENGVSYGIMQWDRRGDLSVDEMKEMAEEIMES